MKDSLVEAEGGSGALRYPFEQAPQPGAAVEVAPGVLWLRMPLPFALSHINVWAIADGDGWTVVDTGMQVRDTVPAWKAAFDGPLAGRPVRRVISTHMHPDHMGMAGWLTRRFDCAFWTTRLEYLSCRVMMADTGREAPPDALRFYRAAGWDEDAIEHYKARFGAFGKAIYALPDSFVRVSDGDEIAIGAHTWRAVVGRGHSPEHLCLHCPSLGLFISGDQVLPRISSNVSVYPSEPEADPLGEWLESIETIRARVPDDVLVLPSHNEPFRGLHARLGRLAQGHEKALARLRAALGEPRRATDAFSALFHRPISAELLGLATGESLAHLNYLLRRGQARRESDARGVHWYRSA